MAAELALKCPVCGARFRGSTVCSRCGTDLTALMRIAAKAWARRRRRREALEAGDLWGAMEVAPTDSQNRLGITAVRR